MIARILAFSAFVALLTLSNTASSLSQDRTPTAQQSAAIEACVKQKAETAEGAEVCISKLVADPCLQAETGATQGMADCFRVETQIWDRLLNDAFKQLNGELDADQKTKLRDMQRAWIASRDSTCGFYHDKVRGSMAVPMSAECMMRKTARRALLLRQFTGL